MKTTQKQFKEFKKWVLHYMDIFKLDEWDCYFEMKELQNAQAETSIKYLGRTLNFILANDLSKETLNNTSIKEIARHEVCHILFIEVAYLVASFCTKDEYDLANEKVAVKLTKLFADK